MLRLEHVNLVVRNIPKSLAFYQAAFPHWKVRGEGTSSWNGKPRNWVHIGDDYNYITLNDNGEADNRDLSGHQVGLAHFGFEVSNLGAVIERLGKAGFEPRKTGGVDSFRRNEYFLDPDGFEVEFVEYQSELPEERNLYS